MSRTAYPSDVSDEEWAFAAPYLTLMSEAAPQREHELREVFNGLRLIIRARAPWRMLPHALPLWAAVYQQSQRWWHAGVFEAMVSDLRAILRLAAGRKPAPSAAIVDSRTLQSSPESGARAGYDGAKRKREGFILLSRRWVVERNFAWAARLRRLARDYEHLPESLADLHFLALALLMLHRFVDYVAFVFS